MLKADIEFIGNPIDVADQRPPKEWWYFMVERIGKRAKGRKLMPISPRYKTKAQIIRATAGAIWYGTMDGMRPETKRSIINEIIKNRAKGKVLVVTGRQGTLTKKQVEKEIGKTAAKQVYSKIKLTKMEIEDAKQALKRRPALTREIRRERLVASNPYEDGVFRPRYGREHDGRGYGRFGEFEPNPELLMVFGNPAKETKKKKAKKKVAKKSKAKKTVKTTKKKVIKKKTVKTAKKRNPAKVKIKLNFSDPNRPPSVEAMSRTKEFKEAAKLHRKFHGVDPEKIRMQWVDSDMPHVGIILGESPEAVYHVKGLSRKQKKIPFKHEFKGKVHKVASSNGKVIFDLPDAKHGKKVKVSDWIRG